MLFLIYQNKYRGMLREFMKIFATSIIVPSRKNQKILDDENKTPSFLKNKCYQKTGLSASFRNPLPGIHKSFYPGTKRVRLTMGRIMRPLPGKYRPLQMRHHGQMATIVRSKRSSIVGRTVGVSGVLAARILDRKLVLRLLPGKMEFAFAVGYPNTQARSG